jgi:hypothetical protein
LEVRRAFSVGATGAGLTVGGILSVSVGYLPESTPRNILLAAIPTFALGISWVADQVEGKLTDPSLSEEDRRELEEDLASLRRLERKGAYRKGRDAIERW